MNFTTNIHRERDAEMVKELYDKSRWVRNAENQSAYENAADWFASKHHTLWQDWTKEELHR